MVYLLLIKCLVVLGPDQSDGIIFTPLLSIGERDFLYNKARVIPTHIMFIAR